MLEHKSMLDKLAERLRPAIIEHRPQILRPATAKRAPHSAPNSRPLTASRRSSHYNKDRVFSGSSALNQQPRASMGLDSTGGIRLGARPQSAMVLNGEKPRHMGTRSR